MRDETGAEGARRASGELEAAVLAVLQDAVSPDAALPDAVSSGPDAVSSGPDAVSSGAASSEAVSPGAASPGDASPGAASPQAVSPTAAGALSPADVRARIGGDLAYTTVVTILSRLHDKGVLRRYKDGRAYRYAPVADQPGLAARRMTRVLDDEPDREAVLARFVSGLSDRDEDLLRRMLGQG